MKRQLIEQFLSNLEASSDTDRKITTSLESAAVPAVLKWKGQRTVKATVESMIGIADVCLEKSRQKQVGKPTQDSGKYRF